MNTSSGLFIGGSNVTVHNINLILDEAMTVGTYDIIGSFGTSTQAGGQYGDLTSGSDLYEATSGTLLITKHDTDAKGMTGTFSFVADQIVGGTGTVSITNGSFCINY